MTSEDAVDDRRLTDLEGAEATRRESQRLDRCGPGRLDRLLLGVGTLVLVASIGVVLSFPKEL